MDKTLKKSRLLLLSLIVLPAMAQQTKPNQAWGEPTKQEMTMTTYTTDPDADAVELFRAVEVNYVTGRTTRINVDYHVRRRIKVLKPHGERFADVKILFRNPKNGIPAQEHVSGLRADGQLLGHEGLFSAKNLTEYVTGLKATAYNMVSGKVVKTDMRSNTVNNERIDWLTCRKTFRVPDVKVGTVIEYEYTIESEFYFDLRDWYAQSTIPVVWTSYQLSIPEWFDFHIEATGSKPLESRTSKGTIDNQGRSLLTREYTFTGQNLPALRDDSQEDDICKVRHELQDIYVPHPLQDMNTVYQSYSEKWEDVVDLLIDDEEFGWRIKNSSPLKDEIVKAGIPTIADKRERATAVLRLLQQYVRWNGDYALWAKRSASKVLKEGTGTNAEINFLLINMLHDAGVKAYPVVLRSRELGSLPSWPTIKYLSTFVVGIAIDDSTTAFADGSTLDDPRLDTLPVQLKTDRALAIQMKGTSGWSKMQGITRQKRIVTEWVSLK